ncbi:MAG: acetyl-CoA carboxylase biotin carboxylase subunit [Aggregatilineales bacterium]
MPEQRSIQKVLIANRGEIAVRIIRACRDLGIPTVAVYSSADRTALHVRYADEAVHIGPPPPRESYLRIDAIIEAARKTGADAVHPGYGFLAENADFAQACADEKLIFIGPPPSAIAAMGDKQAARRAVRSRGVPLIPGTEADKALRDDELIAAAQEIGFPVMVKASAGGGGKGMRAVYNAGDLPGALAAARREAKSAFGDDRVYLEKLLASARHIEIQVLADMHGRTIHLGERECSIQRRHQKLVEEAPSVFVDDDLRRRMGESAIAAAEAVGYVNAGTVEYLVDENKNFYFLEMNTRLQVEHPVTELITGVDIVKEQIRIARGRPMGPTESLIQPRGWAIECRINAEDPYNNFLPSIGRVSTLIMPTGPGVRVDSGVYAGYEITPYYDSMIAKLICWGEDRAEAMLRTRRALAEFTIMGVQHNVPFHINLLNSFSFIAGKVDTMFIEQRFSMNTYESEPAESDYETAALAATLFAHRRRQLASQVVAPGKRDTSNWKWVGRYERMHR